jgi:hypothetical protein
MCARALLVAYLATQAASLLLSLASRDQPKIIMTR